MQITEHGDGADRAWTLENDSLKVRLELAGLDLTVLDKRAGKEWRMEPERTGFTIQRYGLQIDQPLEALQLAEFRQAREGEMRGVELMSVCPDPWIQYNVRIRALLAEEGDALAISVAPHEDPGYVAERWVRTVRYPRSFIHSASGKARTALPFQQGTLLPGDWPDEIMGTDAMKYFDLWLWESATGPWWGHVDEGGAAYVAVMETPDDATFEVEHPAGGPTRVAPRWVPSFEAFRYPRRMLYRFFPDGDHVTLALAYRDYCRRTGRWRSIEEKLLEKPQLDRLRGAIGIPRGKPESAEQRVSHRLMALLTTLGRDQVRRRFRSFAEIAAILRETARDHPDENVYFVLAGWQVLGYDHAHPAACPPSPEAGGWEGMREVSRAANEGGFLFGVHDQYRDFFLSSPFWSDDLTRKDSRRDSCRHSYWAGGTQSILCPSLMLDFVKMNVQQLRDQHVALNATYQDVLTAIPLEECYDHRHPLSRADCRLARYSIIEYYRELGWLIASESASDWAAPGVDYFNVHWPRKVPGFTGEALGIPVPLFSLVYHDCAVLMSSRTPTLICALSGVSTLQPNDRLLRRLHKETAWMPLTAHRLLSDDGQEQESVFGDQVTVRANLRDGTYTVTGLEEGEISGELDRGWM